MATRLNCDLPRTHEERRVRDEYRSRRNISRMLVRFRLQLGLTQEETARRAGTKQARISEIESLRGNVRFDTLDRIARVLGLEITLQPVATESAKKAIRGDPAGGVRASG